MKRKDIFCLHSFSDMESPLLSSRDLGTKQTVMSKNHNNVYITEDANTRDT